MERVTPIKYLMKSIKESFLGIKNILKKPTLLLPGLVVSIIWGILSYIVAKGNNSDIVYILSIITFAQGGMYAGFVGAVGGIIGKGIIATVITKLFIKKEKRQKEKVKGNSFVGWMLGIGLGLIIYNFLSGNASLENALIGITVFMMIIRNKKDTKGFWYGFLPTFSKNIEKGTVKSVLSGMSFGLIVGIVISCIKVDGNFLPYIVGAVFIVLSILVKIINKPKKVLATIAILFICICNVTPIFAEMLPKEGDKAGLKIDYKFSGVTIESQEDKENDYTYNNNPSITRTIKGTCTSGDPITLTIQFYNDWDLYANARVSAYSPFSGDSDKNKKIDYTEKNFSKIAGKTMTFTYPVTEDDHYVKFNIYNSSDYYILDGKVLKDVNTLSNDFLYAELLTGGVHINCEFENIDRKKSTKTDTEDETDDEIDDETKDEEDDEIDDEIDDEADDESDGETEDETDDKVDDNELEEIEEYWQEHVDEDETVAISVAAYVAALLSVLLGGTGIGPVGFGGGNITPNGNGDNTNPDEDNDDTNPEEDENNYIRPPEEDEYITIKDPASGAETIYKMDPDTGAWLSIDGFSQLDPSRLDEWYKQRESDRKWMDEQNEKTRLAGGSETFRKALQEKEENDRELAKMIKEAEEREQKRKDDNMKYWAEYRDYYDEKAKRYTRTGNILRAGEVTATVVSVAADSAIDVYGHVDPKFARGYKIAKATLVGASQEGWAGAAKGAINGIADAALVGTKISLRNKAYIRFGSRVISSAASSAIKGENAEQMANSITNGMVEGVIHSSTGFVMDKLTMKLPKFKINENTKIDEIRKSAINTNTIKKLFGKEHGGLQKTLVRGVKDLYVKPRAEGTTIRKYVKNDYT